MRITAQFTEQTSAPVGAGLLQRKCDCGQHTIAGGECNECGKRQLSLQRATRNSELETRNSVGVPAIVNEVLNSPGQPLDATTRAFMEPRFGHDFSNVRVHTDSKSADSAGSVNALAYTVGQDVFFGAGQYSPGTNSGRKLIAHELAHALQQRKVASFVSSDLEISDHGELELEADLAAAAILSGGPLSFPTPVPQRIIARKPDTDNKPPTKGATAPVKPSAPKPVDQNTPKEPVKCEQFPGGSTDCVIDEQTGIPTGKVTHSVDETNPCTKPCVEEHEQIHVKQLQTYCKELRDCYLGADKGKRDPEECMKMGMYGTNRKGKFGTPEKECEAYKVSVPCIEKRFKQAKECRSKENKEYATRKLASEKCFREKNCGIPASK
jgi:hypothetical protein